MENFDEKLASFIAGCQKIINDNTYGDVLPPDRLETETGRRYIRVWKIGRRWVDYTDHSKGAVDSGHSKSAYCFVDMKSGDVLKTDGWRKPAKYARGNIFDAHNGLKTMGPYGCAYLR